LVRKPKPYTPYTSSTIGVMFWSSLPPPACNMGCTASM
jgi:hypothetical protein